MKRFAIAGSPHIPLNISVRRIMQQVLLALIPGILAHVWFFGWGILFQILLASLFALGFEYLSLRVRGVDPKPFLGDYSALLTAVLFALCVPPLLPWWINACGMFFAIVVTKHLYGGIGKNIFNPAMVAYVVILIAFPQHLTHWLAPSELRPEGLGGIETLRAILTHTLPAANDWDSITQATPLDLIRTETGRNRMIEEIRQLPVFGDYGGLGWEWIANFFFLGGIFLLYRKIISWHVPVATIGTVILIALPFSLASPDINPTPLQHVFSGAIVLGAFFIATDPVTGCTTPRGKLIFGAMVGILVLIIRRWGSYPDAVAFSVLMMNMAAPLIDQWTRPRVFGENPPLPPHLDDEA